MGVNPRSRSSYFRANDLSSDSRTSLPWSVREAVKMVSSPSVWRAGNLDQCEVGLEALKDGAKWASVLSMPLNSSTIMGM